MIKRFNNYEEYFSVPHKHSHEILDGTGQVMVSAPHSVPQFRRGKIKVSEPQTGALAMMLNKEIGCPVIFKTANLRDDANYDLVSPYKNDLKDYIIKHNIKLLIDLHQMSPKRDIMFSIGTGQLKNISDLEVIDLYKETFLSYGFKNVKIDVPFKASFVGTVSSFISSECKIPAMQIEINSRLVYDKFKECDIEKVYNALAEAISKTKK